LLEEHQRLTRSGKLSLNEMESGSTTTHGSPFQNHVLDDYISSHMVRVGSKEEEEFTDELFSVYASPLAA
jgi:hypothetical protein